MPSFNVLAGGPGQLSLIVSHQEDRFIRYLLPPVGHMMDDTQRQQGNRRAWELFTQGRFPDARQVYLSAISEAERAGLRDVTFAASLHELGVVYAAEGRYADAEPVVVRALGLFEEFFGNNHSKVAACLNDLANIYTEQGKYARAKAHYQRSLAIDEHISGGNHPFVGIDLGNIASLKAMEGDFADAAPLFERSLAILQQTLGPNHPQVARILCNLASLHLALGDLREARTLYQQSTEIYERTKLPKGHLCYPLPLFGLATVCLAEQDLLSANDFCKRALAGQPNSVGLDLLAEISYALGEHEACDQLLAHSFAIKNRKGHISGDITARGLFDRAKQFFADGMYYQADRLLRHSLGMYEMQLGPEDPMVVKCLETLAELYGAWGKATRAEFFLKRASRGRLVAP